MLISWFLSGHTDGLKFYFVKKFAGYIVFLLKIHSQIIPHPVFHPRRLTLLEHINELP